MNDVHIANTLLISFALPFVNNLSCLYLLLIFVRSLLANVFSRPAKRRVLILSVSHNRLKGLTELTEGYRYSLLHVLRCGRNVFQGTFLLDVILRTSVCPSVGFKFSKYHITSKSTFRSGMQTFPTQNKR